MENLRGKSDQQLEDNYNRGDFYKRNEIGKELERRGYTKKDSGEWTLDDGYDDDEEELYEETSNDSNSGTSSLFGRFLSLLLVGAVIIYLFNPTILKDVFGTGSEAKYENFNDAVSKLAYQDAGSGLQWTASTGEKKIMFYAEEDNIMSITNLGGGSEETSVGLKASIKNYDGIYFEGKVTQTPDSKKDWLNKNITIEQIDNNNIVINIGNEKITLTK